MNRCATCKWWGTEPAEGESNRHDCSCPKLDYFNSEDDGLNPVDAESYSAKVVTGKSFGCIHHEPK